MSAYGRQKNMQSPLPPMKNPDALAGYPPSSAVNPRPSALNPITQPMPRHSRILPHSPWCQGKARNGKIARLPEHLREKINLMLLDGLTYEAIIANLGDDGKHLNYHNLKRWRQGGYQDWLLARQAGDRSQIRHEFVQRILNQTDPKDIPSKVVSAVALQYLDNLLNLDTVALDENLQGVPGSFISLLNTLARNAEQGLNLSIAKDQISQTRPPSTIRTKSELFVTEERQWAPKK